MKLHEKLGLSDAQVDASGRAQDVRDSERILDRVDLIPAGQQELPVFANATAIAYYLMEVHDQAREFGRRATAAALDYFLGDWRTKIKTDLGTVDPAWWHDKEAWMEQFRSALIWGSALDDWVSLQKLAAYPDDRRRIDLSDEEKQPAMRLLLLEIARHLRGDRVTDVAVRVGELDGRDWRGTRVLAQALDAIAAKDQRAASEAINAFLKLRHHRKRSSDITDTISTDATFMVHLATHEGLAATIDPAFEIYIVRL